MSTYAAIPAPSSSRAHRPSRRIRGNGPASWFSSVTNLLNTILGAGLLAMPAALSHMGIAFGSFVIVWSALTSGFGLYLQIRCAEYVNAGTASFFALSQLTFPKASILFDTAIAIKCFGVGVSYLIVIGDLMPGVTQAFLGSDIEGTYLADRQFWITAFMVIVIPLAFSKRLDSLKYTSLVALVAIGYLVILVVGHYIKGDTIEDRGEVLWFRWASLTASLGSFPVVVFAYTCHQIMFPIVNEIRNSSRFRNASVAVSGIGTACSLYILVALTGYLSYGNHVRANIISMYAPSLSSTIGRAAIVILVMFSYPLQVHPCRNSLTSIIKWRSSRKQTTVGDRHGDSSQSSLLSPSASPTSPSNRLDDNSLQQEPTSSAHASKSDPISDMEFAIMTTIIVVLSYVVAMTVTKLERVLAYVGSTGSTSISFILPGLFYYKISDPDSPHHQRWLKDNEDEDFDLGDESDQQSPSGESGLIFTREGDSRGSSSVLHSPLYAAGTAVQNLISHSRLRRRKWRQKVLRQMALCLAIYGICVMILCLGTNIFLL